MKMLPVVILAGGLATRLRPLTNEMPKSLVPINGEPFIFHQLRLLKSRGVSEVLFCLGYLGERVEKEINRVRAFGLQVRFHYDGESLLGTGGAIKSAFSLLTENFFVLYGDSYLDCDYMAVQEAYFRSKKQALMTVFRNHNSWDSSNVEFQKGEIVEYNKNSLNFKMKHIDYGLGVFSKDIFVHIQSESPTDLSDIYMDLLKKNQLAAYEIFERFYEVGSLSGIRDLSTHLAQQVGLKI